jgi:hypothetical protein
MAPRGKKANRDWINDPEGELPAINSPVYKDNHFT